MKLVCVIKSDALTYQIDNNKIIRLNCEQTTFGFEGFVELTLFEHDLSDEFLDIFYTKEHTLLDYTINNAFFYKGLVYKKEVSQISSQFRKYIFSFYDIAKGILDNLYLEKIYKNESLANIIKNYINDNFYLTITSDVFNHNKEIINIHSLSFYEFIIYLCGIKNHVLLYHYQKGEYEITASESINHDVSADSYIKKKNIFKLSNYDLEVIFDSTNSFINLNDIFIFDNVSLDLENNAKYTRYFQAQKLVYEIKSLNQGEDFSIKVIKKFLEYTKNIKILLPEYSKKYSYKKTGLINIGNNKQESKKYKIIEKPEGLFCSVHLPDYNISIPAKFSSKNNLHFIPPYNNQKVEISLGLFSAEIINFLEFRLNSKPIFEDYNNIIDLGYSKNSGAKIKTSLRDDNTILEIVQNNQSSQNILEMSPDGVSISIDYD